MRTLRQLALVSAALLAAGCVAARPTSSRELLPTDVNNCYVKAKTYGNPGLAGSATLFLYVDEDGAVPAAWVHDKERLDSANLFRCLGDIGTISKFEGEKTDYLRAFKVDCEGVGCGKQPVNQIPTTPLDEVVAKDSLTFPAWATPTDKGWGYYYTKQYSDAIATFRVALDAKPGDTRAMRGLAQSMAESGGDLKAAREIAEKAVAAKKSAATLEAVIRVCLKAGDDECVVKHFIEASKAEDKQTRSFELASLNDVAKEANVRIEVAETKKAAEAKKAAEEALAKADPLGCYKQQGAERAGCYVKRCFGEGAKAYAVDLKKNTGIDYAAGDFITAEGASGVTLVTVPIRAAAPPKPAKAKKGKAVPEPDRKDATWAVSLGENIDMKPYKENLPAYFISKDHNACK